MKVSKIAWVLIYLLLSKGAFAVDWSGATSSSWNIGPNWVGSVAPSGTATLVFPSSATRYTSTYDTPIGGLNVTSMTIVTSGTAYTIQGTSNKSIPIGGSGAISITGAGALTLQYLQLSAPTTITTSSGASTTTLSNISGSSNLALSLQNTGSFTLNNNSGFSGATTLSAGNLTMGSADSLGSGTLTMSGNTSLSIGNFTVNNPIAITSNVFIIQPDSVVTSSTLSGLITGAGSLNVNTTNTSPSSELIFTNASNSFTELIVTAGTIRFTGTGTGSAGPLGAELITMSANTTLKPYNSATLYNPFMWQMTVGDVNSSVMIDTNGTVLTLQGVITIQDGGNDAPYSFEIKDTSGSGAGVLVLNGNNLYEGGTGITSGTVEVGNNNALGANDLTMFNGTTLLTRVSGLVIPNEIALNGTPIIQVLNGTTTLSESFSGGTGLIKNGSGTLKLTASTNSTGSIAIQGGEIAVIGGTLTSAVAISSGAKLSGTGTIAGNVVNHGNVAPGASIGTLTITGNYTQASNSTYTNEINSPNTDHLLVQGNLLIESGATFALVPEAGYTYPRGTSYQVMTAGGTLSGNQFSWMTTTNSQVHGLLSYPNNTVVLTLYGNSLFTIGTFAGNPGQVQVALNENFLAGNLLPTVVYEDLLPLNSAQLYSALDQMHPAMYKGLTIVQENNAFLVRNSVSERFQELLDHVGCVPCANGEKKRGVSLWASGFGDFNHQGEAYTYNSPQAAYNASTGGFSVGVDSPLGQVFYLGLVGAYTHSSLHWNQDRGNGDINSVYGGGYASAMHSIYYGNFSLIGGWNAFDAQRNIIFSNVNRTASNTHQGIQLITHLDTGLKLCYNQFTIRPFDSLDWIVQNEGNYTESGAGPYDLVVNSSFANMLRNELGLNVASYGYLKQVKLAAHAKVGWVVEARMKGKDVTSSFIGTNIPFTVIGNFPTRSLFSVGGNITAALLQRKVTCPVYENDKFSHKYGSLQDVLTMSLYYNGVFGSKYSDNSSGGSLNYGF